MACVYSNSVYNKGIETNDKERKMLNNEFNPVNVTKKKAQFEMQYYGMSFEDFIEAYGDKEN